MQSLHICLSDALSVALNLRPCSLQCAGEEGSWDTLHTHNEPAHLASAFAGSFQERVNSPGKLNDLRKLTNRIIRHQPQ